MILEYTKASLKGEKCNQKILDEKAFFQQAKESGLLALIFEAMDENIVSKVLYQSMHRLYLTFIIKDETQKALRAKINNLFNENEIPHLFLKGAHLKEMYPKSYLRGMGDIDCLIKKEDVLKSQKLLKSNNFRLDAKSDVHDVYYFNNDEMLEIHQKIYKETSRKDKSILRNPWDYVVHIKDYEYRLKEEYELLHLIHHLSKHILSSGVGYRSLLDIQIYLNNATLDEEVMYKYLTETGLFDFFNVVISFNKRAFGITTKFNKEEISDEAYNVILSYLDKSGIHGKGTKFNAMTPRVVKRSKLRVILRVMFPTYSDMKNKYTAVRKCPLLLPFFYPIRWFTLIFLRTKRTKEQLKNLNISEEEVKKMEHVIETFKLGDYDV